MIQLKEAAQRIKKLKDQFRAIDYAYFGLDQPIVSDAVRDFFEARVE